MGSPLTHSGYACEMEVLVQSWRSVWSAEGGTTPPNAPFGIATLAGDPRAAGDWYFSKQAVMARSLRPAHCQPVQANSGSEGHGNKMAAMRWAQQSNFGRWDNPALPNTFGAQLYDLPEPWANVGDGDKRANGSYLKCCYVPPGASQAAAKAICPPGKGSPKRCTDLYNCSLPSPATGEYGAECVDVWDPASPLWPKTLRELQAPIHKNSPSGNPAAMFMGPIHPRLKRPVHVQPVGLRGIGVLVSK